MTDATLGSPIELPCGQVLANRIMKAALSEGLAGRDGLPDRRLENLYSRWASGRFGLVVTGNVMIDRRYLGEPGNVVLESPTDLDAFARWARVVHDGGSPVWMQLNHAGRQANPIMTDGPVVAPSAVGMSIPGIPAPRELRYDEIVDIIARFARAARAAESAGFDGVQLHAAHGYLLSQFLSPLSNQRTDDWGGSIENRARVLVESIAAIRAAVAPGFAVGVKLNSADFQRGGFSDDESRAVVALLAGTGIDMIEISGGSYESPAMMGRPGDFRPASGLPDDTRPASGLPDDTRPASGLPVAESSRAREAYFVEYAATVRELAASVPIAVTGGFRTRAGMDDAVESGACDIVGVGRPSVTDPELAESVLSERVTTWSTRSVTLPVPEKFALHRTVRSAEGLLELQWHTDQLHLMGAGKDPDPRRPVWRTALSTLRRNGIDAFTLQRRALSR